MARTSIPKPKKPAKTVATAKKLRTNAATTLPKAPKLSKSEMAGGASPKATTKLPGSFNLLWGSIKLIKENWQVLLGLAVLYVVLNLILVQGLNSAANLNGLKNSLNQVPSQGLGHLMDGFSLYSYLLGASGSNVSPVAGTYQFVLAIVFSLVIIWSLRQIYGGYDIRIRDGFYRGVYPLVTFLLVLLMVVVQLVPFIAGASIYGIVMANGIVVSALEQLVFLLLFLGLGLVSLYLLCSSLFALYIVTLPEMTPMSALRTARDLVAHRRWTIMRKLVFLPFALLALSAIILVPVVLIATVIAPWVFILVAAVMLILIHTYMYRLYRSML
jgi:hypothetical protein